MSDVNLRKRKLDFYLENFYYFKEIYTKKIIENQEKSFILMRISFY